MIRLVRGWILMGVPVLAGGLWVVAFLIVSRERSHGELAALVALAGLVLTQAVTILILRRHSRALSELDARARSNRKQLKTVLDQTATSANAATSPSEPEWQPTQAVTAWEAVNVLALAESIGASTLPVLGPMNYPATAELLALSEHRGSERILVVGEVASALAIALASRSGARTVEVITHSEHEASKVARVTERLGPEIRVGLHHVPLTPVDGGHTYGLDQQEDELGAFDVIYLAGPPWSISQSRDHMLGTVVEHLERDGVIVFPEPHRPETQALVRGVTSLVVESRVAAVEVGEATVQVRFDSTNDG